LSETGKAADLTVVYTVIWRDSVVWWSGRGKYGAVIGRKFEKRVILYAPSIDFQAMGSFKPITAPYFPLPDHQTTEPRQITV